MGVVSCKMCSNVQHAKSHSMQVQSPPSSIYKFTHNATPTKLFIVNHKLYLGNANNNVVSLNNETGVSSKGRIIAVKPRRDMFFKKRNSMDYAMEKTHLNNNNFSSIHDYLEEYDPVIYGKRVKEAAERGADQSALMAELNDFQNGGTGATRGGSGNARARANANANAASILSPIPLSTITPQRSKLFQLNQSPSLKYAVDTTVKSDKSFGWNIFKRKTSNSSSKQQSTSKKRAPTLSDHNSILGVPDQSRKHNKNISVTAFSGSMVSNFQTNKMNNDNSQVNISQQYDQQSLNSINKKSQFSTIQQKMNKWQPTNSQLGNPTNFNNYISGNALLGDSGSGLGVAMGRPKSALRQSLAFADVPQNTGKNQIFQKVSKNAMQAKDQDDSDDDIFLLNQGKSNQNQINNRNIKDQQIFSKPIYNNQYNASQPSQQSSQKREIQQQQALVTSSQLGTQHIDFESGVDFPGSPQLPKIIIVKELDAYKATNNKLGSSFAEKQRVNFLISPPNGVGTGEEGSAARNRVGNNYLGNYQMSGFKKTKTTINAKVNSPKHILHLLKNYEDISPQSKQNSLVIISSSRKHALQNPSNDNLSIQINSQELSLMSDDVSSISNNMNSIRGNVSQKNNFLNETNITLQIEQAQKIQYQDSSGTVKLNKDQIVQKRSNQEANGPLFPRGSNNSIKIGHDVKLEFPSPPPIQKNKFNSELVNGTGSNTTGANGIKKPILELVEQENCAISIKYDQSSIKVGQHPSDADQASYSNYSATNGAMPPHLFNFKNSPEIIIRPPEDEQTQLDYNRDHLIASQSSINLEDDQLNQSPNKVEVGLRHSIKKRISVFTDFQKIRSVASQQQKQLGNNYKDGNALNDGTLDNMNSPVTPPSSNSLGDSHHSRGNHRQKKDSKLLKLVNHIFVPASANNLSPTKKRTQIQTNIQKAQQMQLQILQQSLQQQQQQQQQPFDCHEQNQREELKVKHSIRSIAEADEDQEDKSNIATSDYRTTEHRIEDASSQGARSYNNSPDSYQNNISPSSQNFVNLNGSNKGSQRPRITISVAKSTSEANLANESYIQGLSCQSSLSQQQQPPSNSGKSNIRTNNLIQKIRKQTQQIYEQNLPNQMRELGQVNSRAESSGSQQRIIISKTKGMTPEKYQKDAFTFNFGDRKGSLNQERQALIAIAAAKNKNNQENQTSLAMRGLTNASIAHQSTSSTIAFGLPIRNSQEGKNMQQKSLFSVKPVLAQSGKSPTSKQNSSDQLFTVQEKQDLANRRGLKIHQSIHSAIEVSNQLQPSLFLNAPPSRAFNTESITFIKDDSIVLKDLPVDFKDQLIINNRSNLLGQIRQLNKKQLSQFPKLIQFAREKSIKKSFRASPEFQSLKIGIKQKFLKKMQQFGSEQTSNNNLGADFSSHKNKYNEIVSQSNANGSQMDQDEDNEDYDDEIQHSYIYEESSSQSFESMTHTERSDIKYSNSPVPVVQTRLLSSMSPNGIFNNQSQHNSNGGMNQSMNSQISPPYVSSPLLSPALSYQSKNYNILNQSYGSGQIMDYLQNSQYRLSVRVKEIEFQEDDNTSQVSFNLSENSQMPLPLVIIGQNKNVHETQPAPLTTNLASRIKYSHLKTEDQEENLQTNISQFVEHSIVEPKNWLSPSKFLGIASQAAEVSASTGQELLNRSQTQYAQGESPKTKILETNDQNTQQQQIPLKLNTFTAKEPVKQLLLTPANLNKLDGGQTHSRGPKSITTISAISSRKDGKKMINQYLLMKKIGSGNYANVYMCINEKDKQIYAMKTINKRKLNKMYMITKKQEYNFVDIEMAILKKLDHPNVLRLIEIIDDPSLNKLYIVTELVKNGNLGEMIQKKGGTLSSDIMRKYFRDLILAVEYTHDCAGVIHRDIKPENILIDSEDRCKLADFGVSFVMVDGDDYITTAAGSNIYFAPQICKGAKYHGRKSDIWALGVTLYFMYMGKHPFSSNNITDLYRKIQNDEPEFKAIDPSLDDLLRQMLNKDEQNRISIDLIKQHPWVTDNGEQPIENIKKDKINVTEKDLKSVFSKVRLIARVMLNFRKTDQEPKEGDIQATRSPQVQKKVIPARNRKFTN